MEVLLDGGVRSGRDVFKALCLGSKVAALRLQQPNSLCSQLCRLSNGAIRGLTLEQCQAQRRCLLGSFNECDLLNNLYLSAALMCFIDPTAVETALAVKYVYRVVFA